MEREYSFEKIQSEDIVYPKNEFTDDIVFARFVNYMKKALLHKRMDYIRHFEYVNRKEKLISQEEWVVLSRNDDAICSFFDFKERIVDKEKLKDALNKLTEKQKKVIEGYYYKKMLIKDIAKELNITSNAVKQIKLRAIETLKRNLEE